MRRLVLLTPDKASDIKPSKVYTMECVNSEGIEAFSCIIDVKVDSEISRNPDGKNILFVGIVNHTEYVLCHARCSVIAN